MPEGDALRLDKLLVRLDPSRSRATYQRWLADGRVTVDGAVASSKDKPRAGQSIAVRPAPPPPSKALPEDIPLAVLHEDDDVVVIDKAAPMVVHPAPGHPGGTLVNALLHRYGRLDDPDGDPARPGIVHRLDALTSGVMVVARSPRAKAALVEAFQAHAIERSYLAIALGHPPATASWDTMHARHPRDRKRFTSRIGKGKRAVTHMARLEKLHGAALVRCTLETGRTHQIRVHMTDHGFPLLGDPTYGRRPRDPRLREAADRLTRQALHAAVLGFEHPGSGERMRFEVEPPEDFRGALESLR